MRKIKIEVEVEVEEKQCTAKVVSKSKRNKYG